MERIALECPSIDNLLGGGIEKGSVTLLYGEAGAGKTNLCLQLALNQAKAGGKVIYVDTEGLSPERVDQILGVADPEALKNLLVFTVHDFNEQMQRIDAAVRLAESNDSVRLIIIDSMTMYYRLRMRDDESSVRDSLTKQTEMLLTLARKKNVPVVFTSQVYTKIKTGSYEALGGHVIHHNAKTIIRLDKVQSGLRRAVIMKHRSLPEGRSALFRIVQGGVVCD
ncbi:MAG: DNA repair and recombination protein RadB [Candidatus Methanomethylophilaceae archaeon]|nr:DNA repair and recombination protein RadB [Candidatus Methanomethylophilaceae archaeon]